MPTVTPLSYLMGQLKLSAKDWTALSANDKEDLKRWAQEEIDLSAK